LVAVGGGFWALRACFGVSDSWKVGGGWANTGFGETTCGFRDLEAKGEGVRALRGKGDLWGLGDIPPFFEAEVIDLLIGGRFCGDAPVFSNISIKDIVGGIGVRSNACSELSLEELTLRAGDEDLFARPAASLAIFAGDGCCCPVGFGLTDGDLEAARVAAIKDGDLPSFSAPGSCRCPFPPTSKCPGRCREALRSP
jgi:hypothetical protein